MSLKGKDTFSKCGSKRSYSSLGKATNSRFSPGTWILRSLAIVCLLAAVGTGNAVPHKAPALDLLGLLSQRKSCRHVGNRTDAVCLPEDKRIEWSAGRHADHPADYRNGTRRLCLRPPGAGGGAARVVSHAEDQTA